jgi:hypothetical protein
MARIVAAMSTNTMNKGLLGFALIAGMIANISVASAAAERMDQLTLDALDLDANAERGAAL